MIEFRGHFDGKVFVPDEPVQLQPGERVRIIAESGEKSKRYLTAEELARSEVVGMWADRTDITDSTEFINNLQQRIARREI